MLVLAVFVCFGGRGLVKLLLFLYIPEEAGGMSVGDYAMAACSRMEYDYKKTKYTKVG